MKFPVSALPSIRIVGNLNSFWTMLVFSIALGFFNGIYPSLAWIQWIYYFFAMMCLMFALSIFNSTVSVLVQDWQVLLQSIMRMAFYLSGVLFNFQTTGFPAPFVRVLQLNPFFYIINGFRQSMFNQAAVWSQPVLTLVFWGIVLFMLLIGSHLHYKFRSRFVDMI